MSLCVKTIHGARAATNIATNAGGQDRSRTNSASCAQIVQRLRSKSMTSAVHRMAPHVIVGPMFCRMEFTSACPEAASILADASTFACHNLVRASDAGVAGHPSPPDGDALFGAEKLWPMSAGLNQKHDPLILMRIMLLISIFGTGQGISGEILFTEYALSL